MLELSSLRFAWPGADGAALAIDALQLAAGETLFLHGPSGCGKSTLLGLLAGVLLADAGQVRLLGTDWASLSAARRDAWRADHVGYIFQQFNLLPYLGVIDNVQLPLRFSPRRAARVAAGDAERLLERVGLPAPLWSRPVARLSVGQQQRVAAARALIGAPELVIADEPTSALDADRREAFMDLLLDTCRGSGSALVFVSHDERLAARFARRLSLPAINRAAATADAAPAATAAPATSA